jgi:hypothetical protein
MDGKVTSAAVPGRFLTALATTALVVFAPVFTVNALVDPLWFFDGNQIFAGNYAFNERQAKLNRYLKSLDSYDCLIFGSSRLTLLDERGIEGYRCFNFSFSAGRPEEFLAYAEYARHVGAKPQLVIVGIDWESVTPDAGRGSENIPAYVRDLKTPPNPFVTYLSWDALSLSVRTLRRDSPLRRYYTADFVGAILPDAGFRPDGTMAGPWQAPTDRVFGTHERLRRVFPDAHYIGYVPPIAASTVAKATDDAFLDAYTRVMKRISTLYDRFYDFAIPSAFTRDDANSYDGSHYSPAVNAKLAATALTGLPTAGFRVDEGSLEDYRAHWRAAIRDAAPRAVALDVSPR